MPGKRRGVPAGQLARDYGVSLNQFSDEVIAMLARLDGEGARGRPAADRREICAAISAAMTIALDASMLTPEERAKLQPLLNEVLTPFWQKHCASDAEAAAYVERRAEHYLSGRVSGSQVKSAVNIVGALIEALEVPPPRREEFSRTLSPAFAHRMVGDVYRLNDLRSRFGVELSLVAALAAMLQMSVNYDPILRALRIS